MIGIKVMFFAVSASCAFAAVAAKNPRTFASDVGKYLSTHAVAGVSDFQTLQRLIGEPCGEAVAVDATVEPRHKARKVRCWGPRMVPFFRKWGIDAEEFDPGALLRGDVPDVIFLTQAPFYAQGDVEMIYRAAAEGAHVVSLCGTDRWSGAIAARLGRHYDGVLTIGSPASGGAAIPNYPRLFEGFPKKPRLDAELSAIAKWLHGMYLTGDKCLMCVADARQGRIATAVAQYAVGRGTVTLFGPRLYETPDAPVCKRLLLNLIDLMPPAPKALNMPFVYHPDAPEGKPYFELREPGTWDSYLTQARPKDHVWHLAFFFSWKFINGRNFWEPRDPGAVNKVLSHGETATPDGADFSAEIAYVLDGRTILREHRLVKAKVRQDGNYSFDWTGRFEAFEDLSFTTSAPKWDKAAGTCNGNGYCGISMRLAKNGDYGFTYTNAVGSVDARCYGDRANRIDVYAKSKRTGEMTRISFVADKPTVNYTLHWPEKNKPDGFHFIAFPEAFGETLKMAKGEKRDFHYTVEVAK